MKYFLLSLLCLNSFSYFNHLEGCYKTVSVNGEEVSKGPIAFRNQTTFEKMKYSRAYKDTETRKLLEFNVLSIYRGFDGAYYRYSPIVVFDKLGELTTNHDNYTHYTVDSDVMLGSHGIYKKVDHFVELEMREVGQFVYGNATYVSNTRGHDRELEFVLEKETCFEY